MVAGVAAHQHALLVVAADDGPMPQTLEHLAILRLLGVDTRRCRRYQSRTAWTATVWRACAMRLRTSHANPRLAPQCDRWHIVDRRHGPRRAAATHCIGCAEHTPKLPSTSEFRLAVDRAFVINGVGVVVTGTVHSGVVEKGDELCRRLRRALAARARSLRVSDRIADRAVAGRPMRDRSRPAFRSIRSDEAIGWSHRQRSRPRATSSSICRCSPTFRAACGTGCRCTSITPRATRRGMSRCSTRRALAAGQSAMVELVLATPLHPKHGDRLVLRDHATRTHDRRRSCDRHRSTGKGAPSAEAARDPRRQDAQSDATQALRRTDRTRRRRHRRIPARAQSDDTSAQRRPAAKPTV